jgi:hypothetical protein
MADVNRLPRRWAHSFRRAANASDAVLNILTAYRPDYHTVYTNFLGDALTAEWAAADVNGSSAAATVASSQLTLTSGTSDNGHAGQGYGLFWTGDAGIFFESEQSLDTITTAKIEIGLTDALTDDGAVATKASPTGTADDFCVLILDTDDNTQFDLISEIDNGGPVANAEDVYTIVAGTDFTTEFRAQNDTVAVFVNGADILGATGTAASMQGGDSVTPWWVVQARAGSASRILTVNYAICTGPIA